MSVEMSNPWWLLLIPVMIAGLVISERFFRMKNKGKKIKYIVMRGLIGTLLVLTLCGLSFKITTKQVTTIFLVDVSDSNEKNLDEMEAYIRNCIEAMPKKNQAGVVVFGDDVLVDQFVTDKKIFSEVTSEPVTTATNLEKAVSAALTIFPEDTAKRLVLITDGLENAGSVEKMAGTVAAQDIDVKVLKLEQNMGEEVYVSNLELPQQVHIGDTFNVKVTIQSNVSTEAVVSLYSGRTLKGQSTVNLTAGQNQFVFQDTGESNGTQDYHVMVEPVNDTMSMNNEYCAFTQVEAEPKILLVEGTPEEGRELAAILDACGVRYDRITPTGVPEEMSSLVQYKAVVMVNVHARDLRQGFMDNLESYVRDYAGGLICTGGANSYAMGGYQETALETVLPVNMFLEGEREVPTMAIAMVIDHSGSMSDTADGGSGANCLDLAKEAAIEGVKNLRDLDEVGVLAFDDTFDWVVPMQQASNRSTVNNGIATLQIGGGTSIYPALDEAATRLQQSDAQIKHIILLTDGQDYYDQYNDVINKINDGGMTLSTVAVGTESDQQLLQKLANQCGGRYYYTDINSGIPKIFAQEIILSGKSYIINEEFVPVITSNSEIIEGLMTDGVPTLLGYIGSSSKPQATVVLQSEEGDPILATWQYGLGRTIAWTTDASNEWTGNWANWENYVQLWDNMINYVVSNTQIGGDSLEVLQEGSSAVISYTTENYDKDTTIKAVCTDAEGNTQEIELDPVAPGKYEANLAMDNIGIYTISLQNRRGEEVQGSMITAAAMQYSPEYRFDLVTDGLDAFVAQAEGQFITYEEDIFAGKLETVRARTNLAIPLMIAAMVLFMLDILARRMNIDYLEWIPGLLRKKKSVAAGRKAAGSKTAEADSPLVTEGIPAASGRKKAKAEKQTAGEKRTEEKTAQTEKLTAEKQPQVENDWVAANEKRKKKEAARAARRARAAKEQQKKKSEENGEQALDMEELLRRKQDRDW